MNDENSCLLVLGFPELQSRLAGCPVAGVSSALVSESDRIVTFSQSVTEASGAFTEARCLLKLQVQSA